MMKSEELKAPKGAAFRIPKGYVVQEATADISLTEKDMDRKKAIISIIRPRLKTPVQPKDFLSLIFPSPRIICITSFSHPLFFREPL